MNNINWGNFLNNFSTNLNKVSQNNLQNKILISTDSQQNNQNNVLKDFLPKTNIQLTETLNEIAILNQQQTTDMLKNLLNFPKNFERLLSQLTTNSTEITQQTILLLLTSETDMNKLAELLKNNSKEAMINLYKMIAHYNQMGLNLKDEQISQLTKLISFIAASSSSDLQTLKTTMLMYLPWLPLTDENAFKLNFLQKNSDDAIGLEDSITILIATQNYGNIKTDIYKTDADGIKISIISSEIFPHDEFEKYIKEERKKYSININLNLEKKETYNKKKNEYSKPEITMNVSPKVNPFLLLISNSVIKYIYIIDQKENLKIERKMLINNGKNKN